MSAIGQQAWANENTPFFLSNPVEYLQIDGTPPINLTNNAGTLEVNGVPVNLEPVSNWSLYPTLSNVITFDNTNVLQIIGTDLYFNNEILAVASNISNVADWYLYPALSNVQLDNNVGINFGDPAAPSNLLFASNGTLYYNNLPLGNADWSTYPAVSDVNMCNFSISNVSNISVSNIIGRNDLSLTAQELIDPASFSDINLTASGGNRGRVNITANSGLAGIQGEVRITANGGTTPLGQNLGGLVEITANTPIGVTPTLTSAIKFSAAGINSYAGAIPSIGSLAGYNFIYGTDGVNICAGLPSIIPNTPFTTYIYGTAGVVLESGLLADVKIKDSTLAVNTIKPRDDTTSNLEITGRVNISTANQYVELKMVKSINLSNGGTIDFGSNGAITNLKSINGVDFVNGTGWSFFPAGTNVDMCNWSINNVSNINGAPYVATCNWANSPAVGNVNMCNFSISNVSNINGSPYVPTSNWSSFAATQSVNLSNFSISNVSNINGVAYTPTCNWSSFGALSNVNFGNYILCNLSQATFGPTSNVAIQKGANVLGSTTPGTETVQILNSLNGTGNLRVEQIAFQNNGGASNDTVLSQVLDALNPPRLEVFTNVSSSNIVAYLSDVQFRPSYDIFVSPNGNDSTGNGSATAPYLTIGAAVTLRATLSSAIQVVIHISAGTYTENISLATNTYIIGESGTSDPATDPTTIVGTITIAATNTGLFNLSLTGTISATGVGNAVALNNVSITSSSTFCVSGNATVSMTTCRLSNSGGGAVNVTINGVYTINDSVLTISSAGANVIQATGTINVIRSRVESTNTSSTTPALIRFLNSGTTSNEIRFSKINYTSTTTDTGGNKCCIQYANTGTNNTQISQCILECVGAITGGSNIQCIQKTGVGTVNLTYGDLQAVGNAYFVGAVTSIPMTQVSQGSFACFSSTASQTVTGANTVTPITYDTTELNTGGFTVSGASIQVSRAGNYEIIPSIQFDKSGGGVSTVDFWFQTSPDNSTWTDVPRSATQCAINGTNGEVVGTVSLLLPLIANQYFRIVMASADNTMTATTFAAQTTPYPRPAIPSIITSVKMLV